jgi:hypothetical protein
MSIQLNHAHRIPTTKGLTRPRPFRDDTEPAA